MTTQAAPVIAYEVISAPNRDNWGLRTVYCCVCTIDGFDQQALWFEDIRDANEHGQAWLQETAARLAGC